MLQVSRSDAALRKAAISPGREHADGRFKYLRHPGFAASPLAAFCIGAGNVVQGDRQIFHWRVESSGGGWRAMRRLTRTEGTCVMMMRLMPPEPERVKREIERWVIEDGVSHPGIVSIAFAIPDMASSSLDTEESRQSRNQSTDEWVILVEAISETRLLDFVRAEMTQLRCESWGLSTGNLSKIFRHQVRVGRE
ncbi:hypothetical protein [Paraburkholderia diazotrophica]|uniref:hypothetical protein n=1 Tax=Paraburkholderia diazotrophica TaxID=667676 RepID=UPI0015A63320|nr:hypothetical protein [Paraburkholderia diazotrophica]